MEWIVLILLTFVYLSVLIWIEKRKQKENKSDESKIIPYIIATPQNYIIHVVENEDSVDYREYADLSINIKDIIKTHSNNERQETPSSPNIRFEEIDFAEYIQINIKQDEH